MSLKIGLRGQLVGFTILFSAGMWMSKIAQPLYYQQYDALVAFGIGYAVMAVVGGLSFLWGSAADRIGGLRTVQIGAALYCVGIAGRVIVDIGPVILFSAVAGAGASMALVGLRPWIRTTARDEDIPKIVGSRVLSSQIGTFLGTLGASAVFLFSMTAQRGQLNALLIAPCLVAVGLLWLMFFGTTSEIPRSKQDKQRKTDISTKSGAISLAIRLGVIGILSGFYISLIAPYMPLILTEAGANPSQAALIIAVMSAAQIAMTAIIAKRGTSTKPFVLFTVTELAAGVTTLIIAFAFDVMWLAILLVVRAAFVAIAVVAEETIQYAVLPAASAGFLFGVSQSAFLAGDALGGALGAPIWINSGSQALLFTAGIITLINAFLLPALLRSHKNTQSSETVTT